MKKRVLTLILTAALVCALLPRLALAAEGKPYTVISEEAGISYNFDGYLRTETHYFNFANYGDDVYDDYLAETTIYGEGYDDYLAETTVYVVEDGSGLMIEALPGFKYNPDGLEGDEYAARFIPTPYAEWDEERKRICWPPAGGGGISLEGPCAITINPGEGNNINLNLILAGDLWILCESDYNKLIPLDSDDWTEVVPAKYDEAYNFYEGLAQIALGVGEKDEWGQYSAYKRGFIDKTGKEVIPCTLEYNKISHFSDGMAAVRVGDWDTGKWGYIDKTGKEVISPKYDHAYQFCEDLAAVCIGDWETGKWGFVDKTGREVIPLRYDGAHSYVEGLAAVRIGDWETGKWGYIDKTGKEVIPCQYGGADRFSEGLAAVCIGDWKTGKWGYIDKTGKTVIADQYDGARPFEQGQAEVWRNGEAWHYIDKTGKEVTPHSSQDGGHKPLTFAEALVPVRLHDKWGYVTLKAATPTVAYPSTQTVDVDGKQIEFQCYALKDANGYDTNYIKLRDLADILNGSAAQFEVDWNGNVTITTGQSYTPNGSEQKTPFSGQRAYKTVTDQTLVDGKAVDLAAFTLNDDNGGGYTYYKLRDLGNALGIKVDWSAERGIFIETE